MLHFILFLILLVPGIVQATTTVTSTTQAQGFTSISKPDLNEAYIACEEYINGAVYKSQNPDAVCLWFAVGDVLQTYNPGTDKIFYITVSTGQDGWYRMTRFPVQPNVTPESYTHDQNFYLGEYFNLQFAIARYSGTVLADSGGLSDFRDTYQGLRSTADCSSSEAYPAYMPDVAGQTGNIPSHLVYPPGGTASLAETYFNNREIPSRHCTPPSSMGLSCQFTFTSTTIAPDAQVFNYNTNHDLVRCDDLEDWSFPVREFLTGQTEPLLLHDLAPVAISSAPNGQTQQEHNDDTFYLYDWVPYSFTDTDGDGVEDSLDAFPNDPNESLDSDGDGVGDNADPSPYDPTVGGGGTGGGGGTSSGDFDGSSGDTTDVTTQPDDPITTGTGDFASGSCAVEPECSGSATDCAILIQIWKSNCKVEDAIGSTEDDSVTGGGNCSTVPICTGDIIQCSILENAWHDRCDALNENQDFLDNYSDLDNTDVTEVDLSTDILNTLPDYSVQVRTCPAPKQINLFGGQSFEMPFTTFCNLASGLAPLVLAFAYLVGARNIYLSYTGVL